MRGRTRLTGTLLGTVLAAALTLQALPAGAETATGDPTSSPSAPAPDPASTPGPASGPATVVSPAAVPRAGDPVPVSEPPSGAPVEQSGLAVRGSVIAPAAPPSATGWITSTTWSRAPTPGTPTHRMPLFASDVALPQGVRSAILTIAGLGLYAPSVNGRAASAAVLQPGPSDFAKSVEYRSYDVTRLLGVGVNRLAVELGTGVYDEVHLPGRFAKLTHIGGPLGFTARLDLVLADGSTRVVDTSRDWWTRPSGTTAADWYGGESFDARLQPAGWTDPAHPLTRAAGWSPAVVAAIPSRLLLHPQAVPAVTAGHPVRARSVRRLAPGDWAVDYGTYVTGQPQVTITAPRGTHLLLYPAEQLRHGVPDQTTAKGGRPGAIWDGYTTAGSGTEVWHPQFVYHGFRYLRVRVSPRTTLRAAQFSAIPVRTRLPAAGAVSTSSPTFNRLIALTDRSIDANLQAVLTDCPNREKLGWTEQDTLLFDLLSGRYDLSSYGTNEVRLIAEAQRADGSVPEISPELVRFAPPFKDDVNWGAALVLLPWQLYRTYGDRATMEQAYPSMTRYAAWLRAHASGNLLRFGLGDWETPAKGANRDATTSMGYYAVVSTLARVAAALGRTADGADYRALAARIKTAINAAWYRDGRYGAEQATNAMALVLGLAPDVRRVRGALVSEFAASGGRFRSGEIGLAYLFRALHDMGRDDLLWRATMQPGSPGFAVFVTSGAPALPEIWSGVAGRGSLAHFMLGYPAQWAQQGLAGIDQTAGSVGYRSLLIRPAVFTGPASVTATRRTPQGTVRVAWHRSGGTASVTVTVPPGATAKVVLPSGTHLVGAGTTPLRTGLGTRSAYGGRATPRVLR